MAMGPAYLAGVFNRNVCDVRVYDEFSSGSLEVPELLSWPDMLVLTGLTTGFDRMLHVTAYARSLNAQVIVVAGGPGIRSFRGMRGISLTIAVWAILRNSGRSRGKSLGRTR